MSRLKYGLCGLILLCAGSVGFSSGVNDPAGVPVHFTAEQAGFVTLVVEDQQGNRIKNLTFDQPVQAGDNVIYWDGSSLDGTASPGTYSVRGIFHQGIVPKLEYSIYSPGTPPWPTADNTGGWLADHTAPAGALFLPNGSPWGGKSDQPMMLLAADSAEAGHALMWTDLNGRKLGGEKIRGWNGGIGLARDIGAQANPDHVAYTVYVKNPSRDFGAKDPGGLLVYAITKSGVELLDTVIGGIQVHDAFRQLNALAAYNGLLVLSNPKANELVVFNVRGAVKAHFATIKLDKPGGLAFEPDGKLLAVTNGEIRRFAVQNNWKSCTLTGGQTVVSAKDLLEPKQIIEVNGEIYVSDWGKSHQVKVFDAANGKLLRVIGKAGGPQIGDYDEQCMAHPLGISVDSKGVLWVAENDYLPKRISRWEAKTGKFINAWYGPTQYGGGGFADPKDLSRAYYPSVGNPGSFGLLEFKVDLQSGTSSLTAVRYRYPDPKNNMISYYGYDRAPIFFPDDMAALGSHGGTTPGQTFYYQGRQYFTNAYNTYWYNQGSQTVLWILENGVCRPIAACGWVWSGAHRWPKLDEPDIKKNIPTDGKPDDVFYVWTDLNHDHAVQADEMQFFRPSLTAYQGVIFQPDLSIVSGAPFQIPATVDEKGVPVYDFAKLRLLADTKTPIGGDVALSPDGWTILDCKGYKDGQLRWTLATNADKTPPKGPGDLKDPKRMLGYPVKAANGEAGWLVARYSYMGEIYVYSTDGILVATLGADARQSPFWPYAKEEKGMAITGLTFDAEHFWPFMFGNDNGNVYLCVGKWHSSIVKLDGLDKVKRVDLGKVVLSDLILKEVASARERKASQDALRDQVPVSSLASAKVDGKLNQWPANKWALINDKCSFQLAVSGDKLVVAYQTDQPDLLQNSAAEFPFAFTQGGGLDLMLRSGGSGASREPGIGDIRLFVTKKDGKTLAVLYRQKAANGGNKQVFASPVGQVVFDDVQNVSQSVQVAQDGGNYEFSVPLSVLGLNDPAGKFFRGDVGLVLGNGSKARARIYWHNKEDSMCADVPSEARLNPGQWGLFKF